MGKPGKVQYCRRNEVNWKATLILVLAVSSLWAIVLLILHSGILRSWARTRIVDGIIHASLGRKGLA